VYLEREEARGVGFLECEKGYTQWASHEDFKARKNIPMETMGAAGRLLREELLEHPWRPFIENTYGLDNE
jgi:hypothetical protein